MAASVRVQDPGQSDGTAELIEVVASWPLLGRAKGSKRHITTTADRALYFHLLVFCKGRGATGALWLSGSMTRLLENYAQNPCAI